MFGRSWYDSPRSYEWLLENGRQETQGTSHLKHLDLFILHKQHYGFLNGAISYPLFGHCDLTLLHV